MPVPPEVVRDFALATLASGRVRIVEEDNSPGDILDLEEVIYTGQAFMGDPRYGLIAFDVDADRDSFDWAEPAAGRLTSIGCASVRVTSGSPGSQHWWFNGPPGWDGVALRDLACQAGAPAGQIRFGGADCRPPLSPHRLNYPVGLLDPLDQIAALRRLQGRPGAVHFNEDLWGQVLTTGDTPDSRYKGSRSKAAAGLAVALVNAGREPADLAMYIDRSPVLSKKVVTLGPAGGKWVARLWADACGFVRSSPPQSQTEATLAQLEWTLAGWPLRGRTGETDRTVYRRMLTVASACRSPVIGQSRRALEEHVGVSRKTVDRSIGRLVEAGLLEVVRPGSAESAATYRLLPKSDVSDPNTYLCSPSRKEITGVTTVDLEVPDAFRGRHGLPRAALDTWLSTPGDSHATVAEIRAVRGGAVTTKTVRSHLRRLAGSGLVERNSPGGHRWRRLPADAPSLALLADDLGSAGHAANIKSLNAHAREVNRRALSSVAPLQATA